MIVVFEPQCKGISHEKVNSGFLTALRSAYPDEEIRFYADPSHIECVRAILANDRIEIAGLDYRPVAVHDAYSFRGVAANYLLFRRVFAEAQAETDKILFLSFSAANLFVIKQLKRGPLFARLKLALVLHGEFENIAGAQPAPAAIADGGGPMLGRLRAVSPRDLPIKVARFAYNQVGQRVSARHDAMFGRIFQIKQQLSWRHSDDYRYIALASHVRANAARYLDVDRLNIHTVDMPINFAPPAPPPRNARVRFATFGYGDTAALQHVAWRLAKMDVAAPYEIQIIGMDNRGLQDCPNVTCPSPGKPLTRAQMEEHARDVDVFLILYGKHKYRLSCSGSILEALSYVKPVLHLENDCVNLFDRSESPIGFCCGSLDALANKMKDMIENSAAYEAELEARRKNILRLRQELMASRTAQLRSSLAFAD